MMASSFSEKGASEYVRHGRVLSLIPVLAVICLFVDVSLRVALLVSVSPLLFLMVIDVVEVYNFNRIISIPYHIPPGTSAANGRMKLENMLPEKTGYRYLIVGTGGVGRRLITMLHQRGETNVYGFDLNDSSMKTVLDPSHCFVGDVTSLKSCQNVMEQVKPDVVFHTAAVITYAQRHPNQWPLSFNVNVKGVLNMLQASTESPVKSFILTSSSVAGLNRSHLDSLVRGTEKSLPPTTEEHNAISWYTRSKAMGEENALKYCASNPEASPAFGIIRPASGIFHHLDEFNFKKGFMEMNAPGIGFERRLMDWVFCDNIVLGHLLLEKQLNAGKCNGETFLISNREPMTALEFHQHVIAFVPSFVYWKMTPTFVFALASITELLTWLGWNVPKDLGLLSYTTLDFARANFVMNDDKARVMLGYIPAFTIDEAILQMMEEHRQDFPDGGLAKLYGDKKQA